MSFGIDFGTTNSVLAKFDGQEAVAVPIDTGNLDDWNYRGFDLLFPTVVGYSSTRPELLFGWEGKLRAEENVEAVKRLLRGDDEVGLAGRSFAASTVVAGFFDALRRRGLDQDVDVQRAVVTVPANSTGAARYRTRAAARLGGVQVQALLNEPTAAAIAYVHDAGAPKDIMVFDWGGGTVDVTVLEYDEEDGLFEERASRGIAELGGLEIDERLGQLVLRKLGSPPSWAPFEWDQFKRDIERTKIRLSTEEFVVLTTPDFTRTVEIERAEFEAEITDLVERSMAPLRTCLADLKIEPDTLDSVLMIGGTSQIPLVRDQIAEVMDLEPVSPHICDPLTAVARGAAIAAAILDGELDSEISVATTHALGTVSKKPDGTRVFSEIIPRNATLPRRASKNYKPNTDRQKSVNLEIWEGDPNESLDSDENFLLTNAVVDFPEPRPRAENAFTLTYTYDQNGLLHVKATLDRTGEVLLDREVQYFGEFNAGVGATPETVRSLLQVNAGAAVPPSPAPELPTEPLTASAKCYVVDGLGMAEHGLERPSHAQLTEILEALARRFPSAEIHTVVDPMFPYLVAAEERDAVSADIDAGRLIEAPAGTEGAHRSLLLSLAETKDAVLVTNASFGEAYGQHPWLGDPDRVLGVTSAGGSWVFAPRRAL